MKRILLWTLVAAGFLTLTALVMYARTGIRVEVRNSDIVPLSNVELEVTGRRYAIGSLQPGETVRQLVEPTGDSHVEISFVADGLAKCKYVDCYFEPGYSLTLLVVLTREGSSAPYTQQSTHWWSLP